MARNLEFRTEASFGTVVNLTEYSNFSYISHFSEKKTSKHLANGANLYGLVLMQVGMIKEKITMTFNVSKT